MQDFDMLTVILSVSAFQKYNGPTRMYADEAACKYLKKNGLEKMFERGIVPMDVPGDIDPKVYWAAGKLVALGMEELPSVMIDTDLVIWRNIREWLGNSGIAVIHREQLNPEIYPSPDFFQLDESYHFPEGADFAVLPANTAMLYIRDPDFRDFYVSESLRFMHHTKKTEDNLCHMVFAEQRMLPICAAIRGLTVSSYVSRLEDLRFQDMFTHLWGHKNVLKFNMDEREAFCRRVMQRLKRDFPEGYEYACRIPELSIYREG